MTIDNSVDFFFIRLFVLYAIAFFGFVLGETVTRLSIPPAEDDNDDY